MSLLKPSREKITGIISEAYAPPSYLNFKYINNKLNFQINI